MKKIALVTLALVAAVAIYAAPKVYTNALGKVYTVPVQEPGTRIVDPFEQAPVFPALVTSALALKDATGTQGYLAIDGTNLVIVVTHVAGVKLDTANSVIVAAGILPQ